MAEAMESDVPPASALEGLEPGRHGIVAEAGPGVRLEELPIGALWQVAAWPGRLGQAGASAAGAVGGGEAPAPGRWMAGGSGLILRVEALKWLVLSERAIARPALEAEDGTVLDLSHSRTRLRLSGPEVEALLARFVAIDLRPTAFPEGRATQASHHGVGLTVLRRDGALEVLVFRSFALTLVEELIEAGRQFGIEIA